MFAQPISRRNERYPIDRRGIKPRADIRAISLATSSYGELAFARIRLVGAPLRYTLLFGFARAITTVELWRVEPA